MTVEPSLVVLRLNHRPIRDERVTTHLCMVARAFGADGVLIADTKADEQVKKMKELSLKWGGGFWVRDSVSSMEYIEQWHKQGGLVVHLTMYGEPLETALSEIYYQFHVKSRPLMVAVGASKVRPEVYRASDFNVSVRSQPHSEISALAVFIDKLMPFHNELSTRSQTLQLRARLREKGGISPR
ncbi:MAG: tRNA (cytidine(56)-2'-O)-methyltransferase [Candidatus Marsarchaeota archaeon]|nr:tRNA (cytidine(56)-2'-O)-methyltransferase [Candidatus Marsarchaeota archaeon]